MFIKRILDCASDFFPVSNKLYNIKYHCFHFSELEKNNEINYQYFYVFLYNYLTIGSQAIVPELISGVPFCVPGITYYFQN